MITEDKAQASFGTFTWTPVEYGFQAAVSYNLEVDLASSNFGDPGNLCGAIEGSVGVRLLEH